MKRAVDFTNRTDLAEWLAAVNDVTSEVIDLAAEALRPKTERVVSKGKLRRDLAAASHEARRLVRAGQRGARRPPPESGTTPKSDDPTPPTTPSAT